MKRYKRLPLTENRKVEVYNLREKGLSIEEISNKTGVSKYSIRKYLQSKFGKRNGYKPLSEDDKNKIYDLYKKNLTVKQICDETGASEWLVRKYLQSKVGKRNGGNKKFTKDIIKQMVNMHKSGVHVSEIAKHFNTNTNYVRRLLMNTEIEGYDYYKYSGGKKYGGGRNNNLVNLRMENRYLFYKTQTALGVSFDEVQEKLNKIEEKYRNM